MSEQSERVDALMRAWIVNDYRTQFRTTHLTVCPEVTVSYDAEDDTYGCETGCDYMRLEATLSCPHGEAAEHDYGHFGDIAGFIDYLIECDDEAARGTTESEQP